MSKRKTLAAVLAGLLSLILGAGMARADVRHAISSMFGVRSHTVAPKTATTFASDPSETDDTSDDQGDQNDRHGDAG